jgi:hypothetical protein
MAVLQPFQISALTNLSMVMVASKEQVPDLASWSQYPFNTPSLHLKTLSMIFLRSGYLHHPREWTKDVVTLLRRLQNVDRLRFIRNGANIKGSLKAWYNQLVGFIMWGDHYYRYDAEGSPKLPARWWEWGFDVREQSFEFKATEPWEVMEEGRYMEMMKPFVDEFMKEVEGEEEGSGS